MKAKFKEFLADHIAQTKLRWQMNGWKYRLSLIAKIITPVGVIILAAWLSLWFLFGPPSVNIGDIKVNLDRGMSLAGPDKNANGVRDDIDLYIKTLAEKKGYDAPQVRALEQSAKSMQGLSELDVSNTKKLLAADDKVMRAVNCLFDKIGRKESAVVEDQIHHLTFNTKQRTLAYLKYDHSMSGTVTRFDTGDTCEK